MSPTSASLSDSPEMCDNEPPASLSDFHDYEPNLEFDDTELWVDKSIFCPFKLHLIVVWDETAVKYTQDVKMSFRLCLQIAGSSTPTFKLWCSLWWRQFSIRYVFHFISLSYLLSKHFNKTKYLNGGGNLEVVMSAISLLVYFVTFIDIIGFLHPLIKYYFIKQNKNT